MNGALRLNLDPLDYHLLSEVDFERPIGVMWGVFAFHALKSNMQRISGSNKVGGLPVWLTYRHALDEVIALFRLENNNPGWLGVFSSRHVEVLSSLMVRGSEWDSAHRTIVEETTYRQFLLSMLEKVTAPIDSGDLGTPATRRAHALEARWAIAIFFKNLLGEHVRRFLLAARAGIAAHSGAVQQLDKLVEDCMKQLYLGIATYMHFKTDSWSYEGKQLPANMGNRMLELITPKLELEIAGGMAHYLQLLNDLGTGVLGSENTDVFDDNALLEMFYYLAEMFSFESSFLKEPADDGHEDIEDEEDDEGHKFSMDRYYNIAQKIGSTIADDIAANVANDIAINANNMAINANNIANDVLDAMSNTANLNSNANLGFASNNNSTSEDDDFILVERDEPLPQHVVNHDFAQYQDQDWYANKYELHNVQDVLLGPASTTVNHVAMPIGTTPEPCQLCGDESVPMRQLVICNHVLCEDRLDTQLKAEHASRYKCPFCRAEFFPDVSEDDD